MSAAPHRWLRSNAVSTELGNPAASYTAVKKAQRPSAAEPSFTSFHGYTRTVRHYICTTGTIMAVFLLIAVFNRSRGLATKRVRKTPATYSRTGLRCIGPVFERPGLRQRLKSGWDGNRGVPPVVSAHSYPEMGQEARVRD